MKTYQANKKGLINYLLISSILLPIIVFLFYKGTFMEKTFIILPLLSPLVILFWIYIDTRYKIEQDKFIYRSGFLRGNIEIASIRKIVKGTTMWSGIKPALARNGLIIKFNTYDEIYVAPADNSELISDLLNQNPNIEITD